MKGGLMAADLRPGGRLTVEGMPYRIVTNASDQPHIVLFAEDGTEQTIELTRSTLMAKLVADSATLRDPTVNCQAASEMPSVSFQNLSPAAQLEWYDRMIVLRELMKHPRLAPHSAVFRKAYDDGVRILEWARKPRPRRAEKRWSAKRLNDVLRAWRRHGNALAALAVQLVPAHRKRPQSRTPDGTKELVERIVKKYPLVSTASVARIAAAEWQRKNGESVVTK